MKIYKVPLEPREIGLLNRNHTHSMIDSFLRVSVIDLDPASWVEVVDMADRTVLPSGITNNSPSRFSTINALPDWVKQKIAVLDMVADNGELIVDVGVKLNKRLYWICNKEELPWRPQKQK